MDELTYRVQLLSDPETVSALLLELEGKEGVSSVLPSSVTEASELEFSLEAVAAVVGIFQIVFLEKSLAHTLGRVLRRTHSRAITMNGEFGRVTLEFSSPPTDEQLLAAIKSISQPPK
jgi:hypothetical protein